MNLHLRSKWGCCAASARTMSPSAFAAAPDAYRAYLRCPVDDWDRLVGLAAIRSTVEVYHRRGEVHTAHKLLEVCSPLFLHRAEFLIEPRRYRLLHRMERVQGYPCPPSTREAY